MSRYSTEVEAGKCHDWKLPPGSRAYAVGRRSSSRRPSDRTLIRHLDRGDSLTLAESANLLLIRVPDEGAHEWRKLSVAVRAHGGELYQAARKSDYTAARKAYVMMLNKCNTCHEQFADGEHQLEP